MTRMTLGWHIYLVSIDHTAFMCRVNEHTLQIQILLNVVFLAGMKHCSIGSTVLCKVTEKNILFLKFCLQWQEKPRLDEMGRRFSGSVVNIKTFPAFFSHFVHVRVACCCRIDFLELAPRLNFFPSRWYSRFEPPSRVTLMQNALRPCLLGSWRTDSETPATFPVHCIPY